MHPAEEKKHLKEEKNELEEEKKQPFKYFQLSTESELYDDEEKNQTSKQREKPQDKPYNYNHEVQDLVFCIEYVSGWIFCICIISLGIYMLVTLFWATNT